MVEKVEFKDFKIGELFDIFCVHPQMQKSDFVYRSNDETYPLIMQNKDNNGVEAFIPKQENEKISLVEGNKITMFTHLNRAFYQPTDFYCKQGGNIYILDNENLNKNNALYFCSLIDKSIQDVGYGKNTKHTFLNKKIPLPVDSSGSVNYSYMESYISYIEKLHVANIEKLLQELGYNSLKDVELTQEDKEVLRLFSGGKLTLAEFKIGELFEIIPTTTTITDSLNGGDFLTPLVSNTTTNNGIKEYVSRAPNNKGNVITFSDTTTSSDTIFYQEDDFVGYSHIQKMELKEETLNKNIAMFIISVMRKQIEGKYSWGTKFNRKNAAATVVSLPVISPTTPNYSLMESYITAIEKLHVNKLIYSNNQEITTLNTVI